MRTLMGVLLAATAVAAISTSAGAAGTWVAVTNVTGSTSTSAFGMTDKNIVAGDYVDASGNTHGFVGPIDGSAYVTFDDSASGASTQPRAIGENGSITGFDTLTTASWERDSKGNLTPIMKGKTALNGVAQGINTKGLFGADYINTKGITVEYEGLKSKYKSAQKLSIKNSGWAARGVDAKGDIAGWFYDPSTQLQHGVLILKGKATQIDFSGATYTVLEGINDHGIVSGQFEDSAAAIHGFYYVIKTKKFTQLDVSGATLTQVWGVNNNDVIAASSSAGSYVYCIKSKGCPSAGRITGPTTGSTKVLEQ